MDGEMARWMDESKCFGLKGAQRPKDGRIGREMDRWMKMNEGWTERWTERALKREQETEELKLIERALGTNVRF